MKKNNVFYLSYSKRYYLTHPWKLFTEFFRGCKMAYKRAVYGWCPWDVWDWDNWFMGVVPDQLRYLADNGHAYPGREPFETSEKWHEWLHHIADLIETGSEQWQDEHNEYYKDFMDELMNRDVILTEIDENGNTHHKLHPKTELDKNYYNRYKELGEQGDKNIKEALAQISEHFYQMWD